MAIEIRYSKSRTAFRLVIPDQSVSLSPFTGLIGPSGAGKSTFVRALSGPWDGMKFNDTSGARQLSAQSKQGGDPWWHPRAWKARALRDDMPTNANMVRERFGAAQGKVLAVHQDPLVGCMPWLTLGGHHRLLRRLCDSNHALAFESHLGALGIDFAYYRDVAPDRLSGGQQRRLTLALALSFEPQLLVIDEALGSLDPKSVEKVMLHLTGLLKERDFKILLVSHDLYTLATHTSASLVVRGGEIGLVERFAASELEWLNCLRGEFL